MKFGSVCSGIEAASVAWHPLGWQAAWFAEIEPFPCAVLAHHYPTVPNLGDMTTIARSVMTGEVEAPDVLAGGTPCQAFSVAGLRESLADERGNLTLKFVELADAIDFVRVRDGRPPAIVFWENVPGVLSTKDNAFGCFLAGLAGEDEPLRAPGGKWANAGAVYGPARAIAWRTLDAQYFGLAQRRRRVFVVASARGGFDPATVLFEWDGVRRDSAPRRESGKVAPTTPSRSTGGGGLGTDFDCDGGLIARAVSLRGREGGGTAELGDELQNCLRASGGGGDKPHVLIHADPIARCEEFQPSAQIAQRIKVDERGCWVWQNRLTRHGYGQICVSGEFYQAHRYSYAQSKGEIAAGMTIDHLCKNRACVNPAHLEAVDFKTNNMRSDSVSAVNSRKTHCNNGHAFDEANTGYRNGTHERYCRACKREEARRRSGRGEVIADEIAKCIKTGEAKRQDWETCNFVAHTLLGKPNCSHAADKETYVAHTLRGEGFDASEDGTGRGTPLVPVGFNARQDPCHWHDRTGPLDTDGGTQAVSYAIQAGALRTNPASGPGGVGVQADHAYTLEALAEVQAVAFQERGRKDGRSLEVVFAQGEYRASAQETYPGTLLRTLRQEAGEEAFAQWGLGILDSLQQAEVLRQALHGIGIRPATFSRSWVVCCALGFPVHGSGWLLQSLREAGCERCSSQGWEPSEQLAGELGAYLSELSRPGAQAARFVRDLWFAAEGFGLLQQALLAVQEVGRPAGRKGQSVLRGSAGRGIEIPEDVPGARMQCEAPRELVLHEARAAGEARDYWNGATEQERSGKGWVGEAPLAVRRLIVEECEFLQGFPRGYSKIPWRNKPASECPDGPRYRALGNSWAVPCVTWIGQRIAASLE